VSGLSAGFQTHFLLVGQAIFIIIGRQMAAVAVTAGG
jgi:hypothetical protein